MKYELFVLGAWASRKLGAKTRAASRGSRPNDETFNLPVGTGRGAGGEKKFRETELRSGNIVPIIQRDASASILPSSRNEKNVFFLEFFPLLLLLLLLLRFSNTNLKFNRSRHP